jgi:hypothetical protein
MGNVELSGSLDGDSASYSYVTIGTPDQPFDRHVQRYQETTIELNQNTVRALGDLSADELRQLGTNNRDLDEVGYDTVWPKGSERLRIGNGVFATIKADRILNVSAFSSGGQLPRLGRKDTEAMYAMPLTDEQVVILFGEPEKTSDVLHK